MKFPAFNHKSDPQGESESSTSDFPDDDRESSSADGTERTSCFLLDNGSDDAEVEPLNKSAPPLLQDVEAAADGRQRDTWTSPREFLLSCISMSVGLGNVWRFPQTAAKNGGGAFLIPYLFVLIFIGRPLYFLEATLGQFSSYGPVKLWHAVPILKGVGYGQALSTWMVTTYYCFQMAITIFYFFASFQSVLPWTVCDPDLISSANCYSSRDNISHLNVTGLHSSSSLYFIEKVMKKADHIDDGIGLPDRQLTLCLLLAWLFVCLVLIRGVKSSGKVAYFTAIFPYVVLITLLIRGVTLPGALDGIMYFFVPDWNKLLDANTWYAAVTQCFFSLAVGFGPVATFSSFNTFSHNIYRDVTIISLMDTCTSLLAGVTVFAVLGNLAHETNQHVSAVATESGQGLAFISYPEAIGKFTLLPHFFAIIFFLMMFTLGLGSTVSDSGCIITIICDAFPKWKRWAVTCVVCLVGFLAGLVYTTKGGLFVLDVVDYFGAGFPIFVIVVVEMIGICWIYGLNNFIRDIEFMLNMTLSCYWKLTWAYVIPTTLLTIFVYTAATYVVDDIGPGPYPLSIIGVGWTLGALVLLQIPLWAAVVVLKQKHGVTWFQRLRNSFLPTDQWGPKNPMHRLDWQDLHLSQTKFASSSSFSV